MSKKLRSINTKFWDDSFVSNLNPSEKLLFIYLITNPLTTLVGIYEISIRRICFDTGINQDQVKKYLNKFADAKKAYFVDDYIILPNWVKHQNLNTNMKKGVIREFNNIPKSIKTRIVSNDLEPFETLSNGLEIEYNTIEPNRKENKINIEFDVFWNLYDKKISQVKCEPKWIALKDEDRQKIIDTLPNFILNISDKKYQPNPETYLNQKRWNDEIKEHKLNLL